MAMCLLAGSIFKIRNATIKASPIPGNGLVRYKKQSKVSDHYYTDGNAKVVLLEESLTLP